MEAGRGQLYREGDILLYLCFPGYKGSRPDRNVKKKINKQVHVNTAVYKGIPERPEVIQAKVWDVFFFHRQQNLLFPYEIFGKDMAGEDVRA